MSFTEVKYREVNNDEYSLCIPSDQDPLSGIEN